MAKKVMSGDEGSKSAEPTRPVDKRPAESPKSIPATADPAPVIASKAQQVVAAEPPVASAEAPMFGRWAELPSSGRILMRMLPPLPAA